MKTTLDAETFIWKRLDGSNLKTTISGKIYKGPRPINSKDEDVEVISLPINNDRLQEGVINVNIYVPNKPQQVNEVQDNTLPNHIRLNELATIACGLMQDVYLTASDFGFDVQQQTVIQNEESNSYYVNIRIDYYCLN